MHRSSCSVLRCTEARTACSDAQKHVQHAQMYRSTYSVLRCTERALHPPTHASTYLPKLYCAAPTCTSNPGSAACTACAIRRASCSREQRMLSFRGIRKSEWALACNKAGSSESMSCVHKEKSRCTLVCECVCVCVSTRLHGCNGHALMDTNIIPYQHVQKGQKHFLLS